MTFKTNISMKAKNKIWIAKLKRKLGLTKPIELADAEKRMIKLVKLHYKDRYPRTGSWVESFKPLFEEIYGWSPEEFPHDYRKCLVNKLIDIYMKVCEDFSGSNQSLKTVIFASFAQTIRYNEVEPIDRCIDALCGEIQNSTVVENGVHRFYL